MRVTWARLLAAITITLTAAAVLTAAPSHAATPRAPAHAFTVINQVCQADRGQLCTNSSQCAYSVGSDVISWPGPNDCNNFTFDWLFQTCGNGVVTATCPNFGNTAINNGWKGALIIALGVHTPDGTGGGLCVGINGQLTDCPSANGLDGRNGASATVFITGGCVSITQCAITSLFNYYWTRQNGHLSYYWIPTAIGQRVVMGKDEYSLYAWFSA